MLRLAFNWRLNKAMTGPAFFMMRLTKELVKRGVKIVTDPFDADVFLIFIQDDLRRISELRKKNIKIIQRLDNIYFDSKNTLGSTLQLNAGMLANYKESDAVIFQSEFSKKLIQNHFGEKERSKVICNGIEIKEIKDSDNNIIVCSSQWRSHKRLREILDIFLLLNESYRLYIIGKPDIDVSHDRIKNFITSDFESSLALFKNGSVFLHLSWFDSCPNAAIEALSIGLPLICGNQGGTKELVYRTSGGKIFETDQDFDYGFVDLYNPPNMSCKQEIADYIMAKQYPVVNREPISIETCALNYISFFEEILAEPFVR